MVTRSIPELEAELAVRKIEEELAVAKADDETARSAQIDQLYNQIARASTRDGLEPLVQELDRLYSPQVDPDLKERVRAARQAHRALRDTRPAAPGEARPGTVGTAAQEG